MSYDIKLFNQENYKPTFWSGGSATELITFPPNSDYSSINFLWRLGIAKIDISESTFSTLRNVHRKFMVIKDEITLHHENKYIKSLKCYEQDDFMGDWKTTTSGKATVFNLMTRENYNGELIHYEIKSKTQINFKHDNILGNKITAICIFAAYGTLNAVINNKSITVNSNELLVIESINSKLPPCITFSNSTLENIHIITSIIYTS